MNTEYRIQDTEYTILGTRHFVSDEHRASGIKHLLRFSVLCVLSSVLCLLSVAGCQNANDRTSLLGQIDQLTQDKTQLQEQIEQAESENEQLQKQVQVLSGLPGEVRLENLSGLKTVKMGRYTNLFDKDKDGRIESLIVYIQPLDEEGDKAKWPGAVDVQLWDLNSPQASQALLGEWHVRPAELKKLWFSGLSTNYRLTFDVSEVIETYEEPLTVKVTFTDYLTGKVFKEQKAIEPRTP
jgi:hypothetical protein